MLYWASKALLDSPSVYNSICSTDDPNIAEKAEEIGLKIPFIRPKKLSTSTSPEYLSWHHAINFLKDQKDLPDLFVSVPCTAPLRTSKDLDNMISLYLKEKADFVVGICDSHRSPYFNLMKKKNNNLVLFSNLKKKVFRRQDTPRTFDLTTFAYIAKPNYILNKSNFYSGKARGYYISEKYRSIDIDTLDDLEYAEFLNKKYGIKK